MNDVVGARRTGSAVVLGLVGSVAGLAVGFEDVAGYCAATSPWTSTLPLAVVVTIAAVGTSALVARLSGSVGGGGLVGILTIVGFVLPHVVLGCPA
jgi:hypothetical protein